MMPNTAISSDTISYCTEDRTARQIIIERFPSTTADVSDNVLTDLPVLRRDINFEDFTVIWLDTNVHELEETKSKLRNVINYIKTFDNIDECLSCIREYYSEKIFLIISGIFGEQLVPLIHEFIQIEYIYIFCLDKDRHEKWTINYNKINDRVFVDEQHLVQKIKVDVLESTRSSVIIDNSIRILNENRTSFLWFEMLVEILILMDDDNNKAKNDMIEQCRSYYTGNMTVLKTIDDFNESYKPEDALSWYTRDSFVYRLLNTAFRTENIDIIFIFRFFVKDLYEQLKELHRDCQEIIIEWGVERLTVYRGQFMSTNELAKLKTNINSLISMNTFISTSMDKDVALIYAGGGSRKPEYESVLFELTIDTDIMKKPFANISEKSFFKSENEILISIGTLVRMKAIIEIENVWHIHLMTVNESDSTIKEFDEYLRKKIGTKPTMNTFINYLHLMGDTTKAERYETLITVNSKELKGEKGSKSSEQILKIYYENGDDIVALNNYQMTIDLLSSNEVKTLSLHKRMCELYLKRKDYFKALKSLEQSLRVLLQTLTITTTTVGKISVADLLFLSATVLLHINDYNGALKMAKNSLELYSDELHRGDPIIIDVNSFIAKIYDHLDLNQFALEQYHIVIDLALTYLPSNESRLGQMYAAVAYIYNKIGDVNQSNSYTTKAKTILLHAPPFEVTHCETYYILGILQFLTTHNPDLSDIYFTRLCEIRRKLKIDDNDIQKYDRRNDYPIIGYVHYRRDNWDIALKYFKGAVNYLLSINVYHSMADIHNFIANIYFRTNMKEKALKYYGTAIELHNLFPVDNYEKLANCHMAVGKLSVDLNDKKQALSSFDIALEMKLKYSADNIEDLVDLYVEIGRIYTEIDAQLAIENLKKALSFNPDNPFILFIIYRLLGDVYNENMQHDLALNNYIKAINHSQEDEELLKQLYTKMGIIHKRLLEKCICETDYNIYSVGALNYFQKVIDIYESSSTMEKDLQFLSSVRIIADIYYYGNDFTLALLNYNKVIATHKTLPSVNNDSYDSLIREVYESMGLCNCEMNNFREAFNSFITAAEIIPPASSDNSENDRLNIIFQNVSELEKIVDNDQDTVFTRFLLWYQERNDE